jgi:Mn2+/Fe2+ NRAMP family transporter
MFFFDITILGVYYFLNPIYNTFNESEKHFKSEDHSILLIWTIHSLNILQIIVLLFKSIVVQKTLTISLIFILLFFGFYIYYFKNRLKQIIAKKNSMVSKTLIFITTIIYVCMTIYLFIYYFP